MHERVRLPETRRGLTHHAEIVSGLETIDLYITTGVYPDGSLGEFFLEGDRDEVRAYDDWATSCSILFQCGWPVDEFVEKFAFIRRPPAGMVKGGKEIPLCLSIPDYAARWIGGHYGTEELRRRISHAHGG